jgi:hypothetical protein
MIFFMLILKYFEKSRRHERPASGLGSPADWRCPENGRFARHFAPAIVGIRPRFAGARSA